MTVQSILKQKGRRVQTMTPEALVSDAARVLSDQRIGILVVCDERNKVVGVLSERDLVRAVAERAGSIAELRVGDLLTRDIVTCTPHDTPQDVMRAMSERGFRHMPVVEDGELKGLISSGDILQHMLPEARVDKAALSELHSMGLF